METIIFKAILCSSLLIAIYYLFLQKEKMFAFNRFYLLFALLFSYSIPFVKISLPGISHQKSKINFEETTQNLIYQNTENVSFDWSFLLMIIYISVTTLLLCRAIFSILKILNIKGETISYEGQKVKLMNEDLPPFSFWNKIYLSKKSSQTNIDNRIFLHEKTHLDQKHSLDLILIEVLKIISWFNPAIYLYKKAITDNHEFLADEVIINKEFNIKDYQNLILSEVLNIQCLSLANQFNFNNTKKRFIMMTTKRSRFETIKKFFAVSVIAVSSILFVQKVYALETKVEVKSTIPELSVNETVKLDTIPSKKSAQSKPKLKAQRKAPAPPDPIAMKENELPIPPPPPPARNLEPAEFPEGLNALRTSFSNAFDSSTLSGKGTLKSHLYISIDENGKTTDIKANGPNANFNNEAIRALKFVTQDKVWKPATEDGKAAATVFQLPITMNFQ